MKLTLAHGIRGFSGNYKNLHELRVYREVRVVVQ